MPLGRDRPEELGRAPEAGEFDRLSELTKADPRVEAAATILDHPHAGGENLSISLRAAITPRPKLREYPRDWNAGSPGEAAHFICSLTSYE